MKLELPKMNVSGVVSTTPQLQISSTAYQADRESL